MISTHLEFNRGYIVDMNKDSGIRNDANDWSEDPRYIVDLVKRVVRVSVETVGIVSHKKRWPLMSLDGPLYSFPLKSLTKHNP